MKFKEIIKLIEENKGRKYNSIPLGLKKARKILPGIIRGERVCLTGGLKVGKTKFMIDQYLITPLQYVKAVNNEKELDIKIFVVTLQRSPLGFKALVIARLLFEDYGYEVNYRDIMSILETPDRIMNNALFEKIKKYDTFFEYFEKKVTLITINKPNEINKIIKGWLLKSGTSESIRDDDGNVNTVWKQRNPNMFGCIYVDDLSRLGYDFDPTTKNGLDVRGSMGLLMEYMEEWTNLNNMFALSIQPQIADKDKIESDYMGKTKEEKVEPSIDGLAINKQVGALYTTIISLFCPHVYNIPKHRNYDVEEFKFNYVSLKILVSEFAKRNTYLGLWFQGGAGAFSELPKAGLGEGEINTQLEYEEVISKFKSKVKPVPKA